MTDRQQTDRRTGDIK